MFVRCIFPALPKTIDSVFSILLTYLFTPNEKRQNQQKIVCRSILSEMKTLKRGHHGWAVISHSIDSPHFHTIEKA